MTLELLPAYQYLNEVHNIAIKAIIAPNVLSKPIHTIDINLIGSRLSAKTIQVLRAFVVDFSFKAKQHNINVATDIFRYEPKGATETFEEAVGVIEDIYDIECDRNNTNSTKRSIKIGSNSIRVHGITSNRKGKVAKLGIARKGAKKNIQVRIIDEITELPEEKLVSLVNQATGGAEFNINIKIANPWVISMWYVNKFARFLPFNEKELKDKGQQFKQLYIPAKKTLQINHITNHRVNNYLYESQHAELTGLWDIDETLARVADLGMPGVSEGLIYAPIMHKVLEPNKTQPTQEYRGGLDWGTSTGPNGSATAMVLGRFGTAYSTLSIDKEYYHSNAKQFYKDDNQLVREIWQCVIDYYIANKEGIMNTGGYMTIYYDHAALALKGLIEAEGRTFTEYKAIVDRINFVPCFKYDVPVRIDIIKALMSQGRYKASRTLTPYHYSELEGALWDDTKKVNNRPTRLGMDDHTLDAMEYMVGSQLYDFADTRYLAHNKLV